LFTMRVWSHSSWCVGQCSRCTPCCSSNQRHRGRH
jgi:hypothetical protein